MVWNHEKSLCYKISKASPLVQLLNHGGLEAALEAVNGQVDLLSNVTGLLSGLLFVILTQQFEFEDTSVTDYFGLLTGLGFVFSTFALIFFVIYSSKCTLMVGDHLKEEYLRTYVIFVDVGVLFTVAAILCMVFGCAFAMLGFYPGLISDVCIIFGGLCTLTVVALFLHQNFMVMPWVLNGELPPNSAAAARAATRPVDEESQVPYSA